jgi:hypothetical protein
MRYCRLCAYTFCGRLYGNEYPKEKYVKRFVSCEENYYGLTLSSFQVIFRVCCPERLMDVLGARLNCMVVVDKSSAPTFASTRVFHVEEDRTPLEPVPPVHDPALQLTSEALQVVAPDTGGVKFAALAFKDILRCLPRFSMTLVTRTDAVLDVVAFLILLTLNVKLVGRRATHISIRFTDVVVV